MSLKLKELQKITTELKLLTAELKETHNPIARLDVWERFKRLTMVLGKTWARRL